MIESIIVFNIDMVLFILVINDFVHVRSVVKITSSLPVLHIIPVGEDTNRGEPAIFALIMLPLLVSSPTIYFYSLLKMGKLF